MKQIQNKKKKKKKRAKYKYLVCYNKKLFLNMNINE